MQMKRSQRDPQLQMLFLQSHLSDFAAVIVFYRPFFPCLFFFFLFPRLSHFLSYLCSLNFSIPLPLLHIFSSGRIRDKSQPCRKVPVVLLIKWERSFALSSLFRLLIADWLLLSLSSRLSPHHHLPSPSFSFLSRTLLILHHINLN